MCPSTEAVKNTSILNESSALLNPFSTMTRFHIHSGYYLVILFSFKNVCED
ncbi:hypothetical protein E2C01_053246 [Portunus trituberculatus]|uniref:Uncharacterized protein n=1 Tax=Portunus trituberculatus TaxID=210409 RepID=A0A5B7GFW3_PORTR|nr:hypothetical protein [Portunus trituberculatus]